MGLTRFLIHGSLVLLAVAVVSVSGCDELNQTQPKRTAPALKESRVPVHRFALTKYDSDVAFDTQTGQICRTWDWKPLTKPEKPNPETGLQPQRSFGEFAPTCLSLYQSYPSGTNPQSESISDDQPSN